MTERGVWAAGWTPRNPLGEGYQQLVSVVNARERALAAGVLAVAEQYVRQGWSSGAYARDGKGVRCSPCSPNAERWSLYGAIVVAQAGIAPERWDPEPLPYAGVAGNRIREIAIVAVNQQLGYGNLDERWPLDRFGGAREHGGGNGHAAGVLRGARERVLRQAADREALAARCVREQQADTRVEAAAPGGAGR